MAGKVMGERGEHVPILPSLPTDDDDLKSLSRRHASHYEYKEEWGQ